MEVALRPVLGDSRPPEGETLTAPQDSPEFARGERQGRPLGALLQSVGAAYLAGMMPGLR